MPGAPGRAAQTEVIPAAWRDAADRALHRLDSHAAEHHLVEAGFRGSVARAHLALADGKATLTPGRAAQPDVRFTTTWETAVAIARDGGGPELELEALRHLAAIYWLTGDDRAAETLARADALTPAPPAEAAGWPGPPRPGHPAVPRW